MRRVVVIGGGIAGLSAAYHIQKNILEKSLPLSLTVLERDQHWGGKVITERLDGFVIEGGPDTFLATKPWGVALCRELGLEDRLQSTNPHLKNTYILHRGRLELLPEGLAMMLPTRFAPMVRTGLLSPLAKARMGLDFILPSRPVDGDESLGAFVTRRLGRAAYERLIEPLMSGIYAGDGDQLSLQATFPYLRNLEIHHGGVIKGALVARRQMTKNGKTAPGVRSAFLTPTTGLAELVEALIAQLDAAYTKLRLGSPVRQVVAIDKCYHVELANGESLPADAVILATPAYTTGELLTDLDPLLAVELQAIPYTSTATVSLAYRKRDLPHPLDGYGYVIPRCEGRRALACTWTSTKFPHRAPEGFVLLRVFIGRAGEEDEIPWNEAGLLSLAKDELRQTLHIDAEPALARVFCWDRAMPQYNLGHPERLARIETALAKHPGLALAGNGYHGVGIPDCIHSGQLAANRILHSWL